MMQDIMNSADEFKKSMESISSASREQASGLDEISQAINLVHDLTLSNSDQASHASEVTTKLDKGVRACRESLEIVREYLALPASIASSQSARQAEDKKSQDSQDDDGFDEAA